MDISLTNQELEDQLTSLDNTRRAIDFRLSSQEREFKLGVIAAQVIEVTAELERRGQ